MAKSNPVTGICCPACDATGNEVRDSRSNHLNSTIRRRRVCDCGERFSTIEVVVTGEALLLEKSYGRGWVGRSVDDIEASLLKRIRERVLAALE